MIPYTLGKIARALAPGQTATGTACFTAVLREKGFSMTDLVKPAIAIVGLLLLALFAAWLVMGKAGPASDSTRQADPQATPTPALASRPANTETAGIETATFALG